jgi:hypothetical protein
MSKASDCQSKTSTQAPSANPSPAFTANRKTLVNFKINQKVPQQTAQNLLIIWGK